VQQGQVARGVINRIHNDISHNLGPISSYTTTALSNWQNGTTGAAPASSSSSPSSATSGTAGSTTASGGTGSSSSSTGASSSSTAASSGAGGLGPVNFNLMVQGENATLVLYVGRLPRDVTGGQAPNDSSVVQAPDLRRIAYWVDDRGLMRQEIKAVTATDQLGVMPPGIDDPATVKVVAPEVTNIAFSYFDGSNWQDTWDGTQLSLDGVTPQGPPPAIAVTITVSHGEGTGDNVKDQTFRHVVAIPTANNFNTTALQNAANAASSSQGATNNGGQ
jgi:type II secretion system (T2SS) protein J